MPESHFKVGYVPHDRPRIFDAKVIGMVSFAPMLGGMAEVGARFVGLVTALNVPAARIEIDTNGQAVFDRVVGSARLSNGEYVDVRISGSRAVIPPFLRVNWSDDFECTWTFRTQVIRSASGAEHRTAMLPLPVRIISYTHTEMPRDRGALHTWMRENSGIRVAVPDGFGKAEAALSSVNSTIRVSTSREGDGIYPGNTVALLYPGRPPFLCRCVVRDPKGQTYGPYDRINIIPKPDWPGGVPAGTTIVRCLVGFLDLTNELAVKRHSERARDFEVRVIEAAGITDQPEVTTWMNGKNLDLLTKIIDHGQEISGGYSVPDAYGNTEDMPLDGIGAPSYHLDADLRRSLSFVASALRRPQARALLSEILGRRGRLLSFRTAIPDSVFHASGEVTITDKLFTWSQPHGFTPYEISGLPVVIASHHGGVTGGNQYIATFDSVRDEISTILKEPIPGLEENTIMVESVHLAGTFRLVSDEVTVRSRTGIGIEIEIAAIEVQE